MSSEQHTQTAVTGIPREMSRDEIVALFDRKRTRISTPLRSRRITQTR
jgi:hypothetical protein